MLTLSSPNGELQVCCKLEQFDEAFLYEIQFKGHAVLLPSRLALEFGDGRTLPAQVGLVDAAYASNRTEWTPIYGERSVIRDHYNEMSVTLQGRAGPDSRLVIRFRAYDEGVAFRYELQETDQPNDFRIRRELSEFRFPASCFAYEEHDTEGEYFRVPISAIKDDCERPLTVEYGSGIVACITEAGTCDYSRMLFANKGGASDVLLSSLSGEVVGRTPFATPWRVVIAGSRPGGIRGNEHFPTARHNATLPFTPFPAGAGDYTICYYDERLRNRHTHQLAMSVIVYSPLQFLFWYDKPSAYRGEPEVEFYKHLPVAWDELRVIHGVIGEYVTIARRKGTEWYVATITNEERRELPIPLTFLNAGEKYAATLYYDLTADTNRTNVGVGERIVDASTVISADLEPCGGHVMRIVTATK